MLSEHLEALLHHRLTPIVAVVDANAFGRSGWIRPIVRAAQDGILTAVWSPLIISEVNRLLTWLWIKHHGDDTSEAARRRCSADFKLWYTNVAVHFQVVEDRPPLAEMWTESPPDLWDAPIWTAAVRARESFGVSRVLVITDNLKDGPPPNERGFQEFDGITFIHPDDLEDGISRWVNLRLTGAQPPDDELPSAAVSGQHKSVRSATASGDIVQLLQDLLESLDLVAGDDGEDSGQT